MRYFGFLVNSRKLPKLYFTFEWVESKRFRHSDPEISNGFFLVRTVSFFKKLLYEKWATWIGPQKYPVIKVVAILVNNIFIVF